MSERSRDEGLYGDDDADAAVQRKQDEKAKDLVLNRIQEGECYIVTELRSEATAASNMRAAMPT